MSGKHVPEAERQAAADRILVSKESTIAKEAERYGVTTRSVRGWVKLRRGGATPAAAAASPRIVDAPAKPEPRSGYRDALAAIGEAPELDDQVDVDPDDPDRIPVDAERMSEEEEIEFDRAAAEQEALETLADLKAELVEGIVEMKFAPHLTPNDPRVQRAAKPGPFLRRCVRKNIEIVSPMLDGVASSPWALLGAILVDGFFTTRKIKKAAFSEGWAPPPKEGEEDDQVKTKDAPAFRGAPPPPPPAAEPGQPGRARIVDAPALPYVPEE